MGLESVQTTLLFLQTEPCLSVSRVPPLNVPLAFAQVKQGKAERNEEVVVMRRSDLERIMGLLSKLEDPHVPSSEASS